MGVAKKAAKQKRYTEEKEPACRTKNHHEIDLPPAWLSLYRHFVDLDEMAENSRRPVGVFDAKFHP